MVVKNSTTIWTWTAGYRAKYSTAIAAMAVGSLVLLLEPYILRRAVDALISGTAGLAATLIPAAIGIVACHSIHGLFTYLRARWAAEASEGVARQLRARLYSHLENLPCAYHDRADSGDLVQRCSSDVETFRVFLAAQVVEIARVALILVIAIPIMFSQDVFIEPALAGLDSIHRHLCDHIFSPSSQPFHSGR